jgi:hypothetical protein
VSAHLVHTLSRVAGHDSGVSESSKSNNTESLLNQRVHIFNYS